MKGEGYRCHVNNSPAAALQALGEQYFNLALIDLNYARDTTSGNEGLELLAQLQAADSTLPVVVMSAWSSVDLAVLAMRRDARDFVQKPWENEGLLASVRNQIELRRALRRGERLEAEIVNRGGLAEGIFESEISSCPLSRLSPPVLASGGRWRVRSLKPTACR